MDNDNQINEKLEEQPNQSTDVRPQLVEWALKNKNLVTILEISEEQYNVCMLAGQAKYVFHVYFESDWSAPMFLDSDSSFLKDWVERIGTFIQRKCEGGKKVDFDQFLQECEKSLKQLFSNEFPVLDNAEINTPPKVNLDIPEPTKKEEKTINAQTIKEDLELWVKSNPNTLHFLNLDEETKIIHMSAGEPPILFDLICNDDWTLKKLESNKEGNFRNVVDTINEKCADQPLFQFLTLYAQYFKHIDSLNIESGLKEINDKLNDLKIEEEEYVYPTINDIEDLIIPEIRRTLESENLEFWSIDEWERQIRAELYKCSPGQYDLCIDFIRDKVLNGGEPSANIKKFFPKPQPWEMNNRRKWKFIPKATNKAKELLAQEADLLATNIVEFAKEGFKAGPIKDNLFHWQISLFDFDPQSPLGQELVNYTLAQTDGKEPHFLPNGQIKAVDILFEVMWPYDYPNGSPLFRLIRPRFIHGEEILNFTLNGGPSTDILNLSEINLEGSQNDDNTEKKHPLTMSMRLEKENWQKLPAIVEFIRHLRTTLLTCSNLSIDMTSTVTGIPTDGSFWNEYICESISTFDSSKSELELGGKIYLPPSALEEIMNIDSANYYTNFHLRNSNRNSPWIFEISTKSGQRSFCGVMEFIASEGHVVIPSWLMENLGIKEGQVVQIRKVRLQKGVFLQLEPHTADFHKSSNVKAMLEWVLRRFVALAIGDTIKVEHDGSVHTFNVLKCTPDRAIAITDQDVSVEFARPLSGEVLTDEKVEEKTQTEDLSEYEKLEEKIKIREQARVGNMDVDSSAVEGVDFKICPNCHQKFPQNNTMHELRCERINWFCNVCNMAVLKSEKDAHYEEYHAPYVCGDCGDTTEKRLVMSHKRNECPARIVDCKYCEMKMQYRQYYLHERSCGSVTEVCQKCKKRIARRDLENHEQSCTGKPVPRPIYTPPPRRTFSPPREELFICEKCQNPFTAFDDLQVHMLTEHENEDSGEKQALDSLEFPDFGFETKPPEGETNTQNVNFSEPSQSPVPPPYSQTNQNENNNQPEKIEKEAPNT